MQSYIQFYFLAFSLNNLSLLFILIPDFAQMCKLQTEICQYIIKSGHTVNDMRDGEQKGTLMFIQTRHDVNGQQNAIA